MVIHDLDDFGVRHFRKPTTGILNRENDNSTYGFGIFSLDFFTQSTTGAGWNGEMGLSRGGSQFQWLRQPLSCAINHGLEQFTAS